MNIEKLEELGLTRNESLTYKALLEIGQTKTGAIVKKTIIPNTIIPKISNIQAIISFVSLSFHVNNRYLLFINLRESKLL